MTAERAPSVDRTGTAAGGQSDHVKKESDASLKTRLLLSQSTFYSLSIYLRMAFRIVGSLIVQRSGFVTLFGFTLLCYELCLTMDFFAAGLGIMFLWPFSSERYLAPLSLFSGLHWSEGWFSVQHLWTLLTELLFIALLMLALSWLTTPTRRPPTPKSSHAD
jgi:hypothetical protein